MYKTYAIALFLITQPVFADMQAARDAFQLGKFETVRQELDAPVKSGNAEAEHLLAFLYENGHGVIMSKERAFELYLRSAIKGYPPAQKSLSATYASGRGLPAPDPLRAYVWIKLALLAKIPNTATKEAHMRESLSVPLRGKADEMVKDYSALFFPFVQD